MASILRDRIRAPPDREPRADEVDIALDLLESQVEAPRQQRSAATDRYRRDVDDHLVQEPRICELAGELATPDDPDAPVAGGRRHLLVDRTHITARELDRRVGHDRQL